MLAAFDTLPLVREGESRVVRYLGGGKAAIRLKPTVYSYTANRSGVIEGTDQIRFDCTRILTSALRQAGVAHTDYDFRDGLILANLVVEEGRFRPADLGEAALAALPRFAPVEVVVKRRHIGTPKHRYRFVEQYPTRAGKIIAADAEYPELQVRFDWRNPVRDDTGNRLADEIMSEQFADLYIDVTQARALALSAFVALAEFLSGRGLALDDICFFIDRDGRCIFSEISPDCLRVRAAGEGSLDKDVWRAGGGSDLLKEKWTRFLDRIR
jgi:phosphoribosylaminoimidazole-succinocarboxamide synthase